MKEFLNEIVISGSSPHDFEGFFNALLCVGILS